MWSYLPPSHPFWMTTLPSIPAAGKARIALVFAIVDPGPGLPIRGVGRNENSNFTCDIDGHGGALFFGCGFHSEAAHEMGSRDWHGGYILPDGPKEDKRHTPETASGSYLLPGGIWNFGWRANFDALSGGSAWPGGAGYDNQFCGVGCRNHCGFTD